MGGGERMAGSKFDGEKPDSEFELPENVKLGVGDTYFSGKLTARMARLVTIAAEMGKSDEDFVKRMLDDLQTTCEAWLTKSGSTPFIYDRSWGGLVSCGCTYDDCWNSCAPHCSNDASKPSTCPALRNVGYNFGNGYYNDHHFHYGYWIYTTAVLAKFRPEWEKKWREPVLALIRDYANPSSADKKFPVVRHKDWFLCFSWAGGIKFEPLGRNQESVSEAINSYYALAVYGTVLANRGDEASQMGIQLRQLGRLLMAMEVHGGDTYWQLELHLQKHEIFSMFSYDLLT
ncbi:DSE4 [Symbiodinium microadriaticum]|nr:DSE4 [Symbiodinium microadriaticum]